jgi:hypothetical protein
MLPQPGSRWFYPTVVLLISPPILGMILTFVGIASHSTPVSAVGVVLLVIAVLEQTVFLPMWRTRMRAAGNGDSTPPSKPDK